MKSADQSQGVPASPQTRTEWLRRVEAEYRSAALTQELTLWLIQIGASPDLLRAGLRIARDELRHADLCYRTYLEADGTGGPTLIRETLKLKRHESEPLEYDVTRVCVDSFCLGETIAVPLFKKLRENCTARSARRVLDRILVDEVRHRDFGWSLLGWLLELPSIGPDLLDLVNRELPFYFARLRKAYGAVPNEPQAMPPNDRAWGLMPAADYAEVFERTFKRDWVPRFRALGIDADKAWTEQSR